MTATQQPLRIDVAGLRELSSTVDRAVNLAAELAGDPRSREKAKRAQDDANALQRQWRERMFSAIDNIQRWAAADSQPDDSQAKSPSMVTKAEQILSAPGQPIPTPGATLSIATAKDGTIVNVGAGVVISGTTAGVLSVTPANPDQQVHAVVQAASGGRLAIAHMPILLIRCQQAAVGATARQDDDVAGAWTAEAGGSAPHNFPLGVIVAVDYLGQDGACLVVPRFAVEIP